jgi:hypothetical protein
MVKIFGQSSPSKPQQTKRKRRKKPCAKELEEKAKKQLDKLNPMVVPLLAVALQNQPKNKFFISSRDVIIETPHRLTDNWIASLNRWADEQANAAMLEPPTYLVVGERRAIGPLLVKKIVASKADAQFPTPGIMCSDKAGWKYFFKTGKAYDFEPGEYISFSGKLSGHGEGISFFKRPTKIEKVISIDNCEPSTEGYAEASSFDASKVDIF